MVLRQKVVTNSATALSCTNFSDWEGIVTIFSRMPTIMCCLGVGLGLGLDSACDWLVVMHTYSYYFRLSLKHRPIKVYSELFCHSEHVSDRRQLLIGFYQTYNWLQLNSKRFKACFSSSETYRAHFEHFK